MLASVSDNSSLDLHVILCPYIILCSWGFWTAEEGAHAWNPQSRMHKVVTDTCSHREESWILELEENLEHIVPKSPHAN